MLAFIPLIALCCVLAFLVNQKLLQKLDFSHLQKLIYVLIFSLPFERIPTIELVGVNIKISYILTLIGIYFASILIIKKDPQILQTKINFWHWLGLLFIAVSGISWFNIQTPSRFYATFIATLIVILASILVSLFTKNTFKALAIFGVSTLFTQFFGLYQFVGDIIGIPCELTGLRCNFYTKDVFGIPRIHSTAIEPQHYATFCCWMLFFFGLCSIYKINIFTGFANLGKYKLFRFFSKHFQIFNLGTFLLSALLLVLTISKGAIAILLGLSPIIIAIIFRNGGILKFVSITWKKTAIWVKSLVISGLLGIFTGLSVYATTENNPIANVWINIQDTFNGTSGSAAERADYINHALAILPNNAIKGIGFGQFGTASGQLPTLIVNNVYLEVWLEAGFFGLIVFCCFFFIPLIRLARTVFFQKPKDTKQEIVQLTLFFALSFALIQWTIFSPLYIMPFYIILGLVSNFTNQKNDTAYETI